MKKHTCIFLIALLIACKLFSQSTVFQDDFDSYTAGIGIASQSTNWQTWTYSTGDMEDALVSGEHFTNGDKSLNIVDDNDILYNFGRRVSGVYSIGFNLFVKEGKDAYFNVEHGNRTGFAFQLFFINNGQVWFDNGTDSLQLTSCTPGEWFGLRLFVDLNTDTLIIYKNDVAVGGFNFSITMNAEPQNKLGCIDFYGSHDYPQLGIAHSDYFINDFTFTEETPPDPLAGCSFIDYFSINAVNYNSTYADLGASGSVISTSGNFDDANSDPVNIGFTFKFNCQEFTQFILNTNGFIKLGNTPPSSASLFYNSGNGMNGGIFNSNDPADVNLISPFNHDLAGGTGTPEYRVFTEDSYSGKICTIQFKNLRDKTGTPVQQYDNIEFQIKLYETTNIIDFIYGTWTASANASALKTAACGLKGSSFSDEDMITVTKASITGWYSAGFNNGNYSSNALNFSQIAPDWGRTFTFVPAFDNDLKINTIYALGTASMVFSNPQVISASISNTGMNVMTNKNLTLDISGDNSFLSSVSIPAINPKSTVTVKFDPFTSGSIGFNFLTVSLPEDDNIENNQEYWWQEMTESQLKYAQEGYPNVEWGYGANRGGILLAKYFVNESSRVYSVDAFLTNSSSIGNPVYAVIMDEAGNITGQSDEYIIQEEDLYYWRSFIINDPPLMSNQYFLAGLAVPPAASAYYPLGVQFENPCRGNAYFWSPIGGGSINKSANRFMIGATLYTANKVPELENTAGTIQLFPNPAEDRIRITGLSGRALAEIYSINGILVKSCLLDPVSNAIDIHELASGMYLVQLHVNKEVIFRKLVRQ